MDTEFINAYINRLLTLNSELTNKNVMLETRVQLIEKKYNDLATQYNNLIAAQTQQEEEPKETKKASKVKTEDEQF